ncbi:N6-mAMP deaminase-like isoform X1 [Triticum urartu]|uniref:Adenosine deaminase domain-containing protein n=1 Tax=Triticum urartu TaxID=4572 RepID=A0A8R7TDR1_TRIUA|nr:N6-mAMP deaminase-like isoform X1 [Triticum urartu]XP_048554960.1 N6-mAMP deaminase-like isoform X1 [Triticum urartu]
METSEAEKEMREWCVALPKVELHAHLNGSVRNSTLLELAKELGDKGVIVFEDVKDVIMKNDRSLPECFRLFDLFHILTTDHDTVTRIAKEVVGDFAAENVVYLEIRTTPKNNEAKGMTKRSYMNAVVKGLKSVEDVDVVLFDSNLRNDETPMSDLSGDTKRKKIYVRLLLSIDRRETTSAALDTVNLAMEMKDQGVIGIDLSGNPVVGEWETYLPALEHAKELGIPTTIHCGEMKLELSEQQVPNRKEIQAMLDFCPQRLGHVCCLDDEEWKKLKSSMIPVEICLTSNVMTGGAPSLELHHFADLYNAKHPLSICTDDSGLFSTSLSNEYYLVASTFGLSKTELFRLAQGAVEFVFADDKVKKSLRAVFERAAAETLAS